MAKTLKAKSLFDHIKQITDVQNPNYWSDISEEDNDLSEEDNDISEEMIYDECPTAPEGFEYDKDHYLSSTSYSNFIDNAIKKYKIDKKNK